MGVLHRGDARVVRAEKGDLPRLVAHRQGAVADPVVGGHRQQGRSPGGQPAGDLHLKGQETAPVLGDQRPVQPDPGLVGHRAEAEHHPLAGAGPGQGDPALIEHPAVVIPPGPVGLLVVEAGRDRHRLGAGQRPGRVQAGGPPGCRGPGQSPTRRPGAWSAGRHSAGDKASCSLPFKPTLR